MSLLLPQSTERFGKMYAVVRTGGKQYRVAADETITVEKLDGAKGDTVNLADVLMVGDGATVKVGAGTSVSAEIVDHIKGDKVVIFKKKRRHNYRRKNGHRQQLTVLKITAIGDEAAKPKKAAKAKAKSEATEAAEA